MTVMTTFHDRFGAGHTLRLQQTFRSPQSLCDVAGTSVARNPAQLAKHVVSHRPDHPPTISAFAVPRRRRGLDRNGPGTRDDPADRDERLDDTSNVIRTYLDRVERSHQPTEHALPSDDRPSTPNSATPTSQATVLVLSATPRARDEIDQALRPDSGRWPHLDVRHATIHAPKGCEADHVIITGVDAGGFPNRTHDDPLLQIPLPDPDPFPDADERRLFYVALTRARLDVLLLT